MYIQYTLLRRLDRSYDSAIISAQYHAASVARSQTQFIVVSISAEVYHNVYVASVWCIRGRVKYLRDLFEGANRLRNSLNIQVLNNGSLLSGLQRNINALASLLHFAAYTTKRTRNAIQCIALGP